MPRRGILRNTLHRLTRGSLLVTEEEIRLRNENFERLLTNLVPGYGINLTNDGLGGITISRTDPKTSTPKTDGVPPRWPPPPPHDYPPDPPPYDAYTLTDCEGNAAPIVVTGAIWAAYVGRVVKMGDVCWQVSGGGDPNQATGGSPGEDFDDCESCLTCPQYDECLTNMASTYTANISLCLLTGGDSYELRAYSPFAITRGGGEEGGDCNWYGVGTETVPELGGGVCDLDLSLVIVDSDCCYWIAQGGGSPSQVWIKIKGLTPKGSYLNCYPGYYSIDSNCKLTRSPDLNYTCAVDEGLPAPSPLVNHSLTIT